MQATAAKRSKSDSWQKKIALIVSPNWVPWSMQKSVTLHLMFDNQDVVAIKHEMLVESEQETITGSFNLLEISPLKLLKNHLCKSC